MNLLNKTFNHTTISQSQFRRFTQARPHVVRFRLYPALTLNTAHPNKQAANNIWKTTKASEPSRRQFLTWQNLNSAAFSNATLRAKIATGVNQNKNDL